MRILVVGGGIAGVTAAAPLANTTHVTLVEKEPTLAFHTTGRSAALLFDTYGVRPLWALTRASRHFFDDPPADVVDHPLLSRRGALTIGYSGQEQRLDAVYTQTAATGVDVARLGRTDVLDVCPALGPSVVGAVFERDAADMDVSGIHQAFVRRLSQRGGEVRTGTALAGAVHRNGSWTVTFSDNSTWHGDVIVNAAGAWGDVVASLCSVEPVGLVPHRRTAFMTSAPEGSEQWPLVVDLEHSFYFKPDGVQLLCSPADETPEDPMDSKAQEIDVALAIERINEATNLEIRHVRSAWAGQRTFVADRSMVIGPDPTCPSFIWLVGQGGTGIQTAPAAGELAASLATNGAVPAHLEEAGVDPAPLSPSRLR